MSTGVKTEIQKLIELSKQDFARDLSLSDSEVDSILELSRQQQVFGPVSRNILKIRPGRSDISETLLYDKVAFATLERDIKKINSIMISEGINFTIIKGLSYSYQVYTLRETRSFNDTDILVDSAQVDLAHSIIINSGGEVIEDALSCKSVEERMIYQSHLNTYSWKNLIIELHQTDNNHMNMKKIVDSSHILKEVKVTELTDTFIIACSHLWHHFSYSIGSLKFNNQLRLKLFLDVYESYKAFIKKGMEDKLILERCYELKAVNIVSFAAEAVEEIYGPLFRSSFELTNCEFEYPNKYGDFNISLTERVFTPEDTYNKILEKHKKTGRDVIDIYHTDHSDDQKYIDIKTGIRKTGLFSPLYYTTIPVNRGFLCRVGMEWDIENLYIEMKIKSDGAGSFSESEEYQMNFDHIEFSVDCDSEIKTLHIEPKTDQTTVLYQRDSSGQYKSHGKNGNIKHAADNEIQYKFSLPWSVLNLTPQPKTQISIEITYIENQYSTGAKYIYALFGGECSDQSTSDFWQSIKLHICPWG